MIVTEYLMYVFYLVSTELAGVLQAAAGVFFLPPGKDPLAFVSKVCSKVQDPLLCLQQDSRPRKAGIVFLLHVDFQVDQGIATEVARGAGKDVPIEPLGKN